MKWLSQWLPQGRTQKLTQGLAQGLAQGLPGTQATTAAHGGLRLQRNKPGLPSSGKIETLHLPEQLVLPLLNYRQEALLPWVRPGQHVNQGQALAQGLVASASGCIVAIEPRPIMHPSGREENCVVIKPDNSAATDQPAHPPIPVLTHERLAQCAVTGLGGAGFATASKFSAALHQDKPLDTLLINAVECEPMISCDEALMMCESHSLLEAIETLMAMSRCRRCVLAIENDKLVAISALRSALRLRPLPLEIQLLDPVYPAGAERSLIRRITGVHLAAGERPVERGIICINVATVLAARQAQLGYPQTSRIVTLAGEGIREAINVRVTFGTSITELLRQSGNEHLLKTHQLRARGPLSGFDIHSAEAPITATSNCITLRAVRTQPAVQACIRCNACSEVCPEQLLPQQLYWYARGDDLIGADRFGIDSCIECGCCDVVCPSAIPLTQTFRYARDAKRALQRQEALSIASEQRYQSREKRLVVRAAEREDRRRAAKARLATAGADPIADALERARQRRQSRSGGASRKAPGTGKPDS